MVFVSDSWNMSLDFRFFLVRYDVTCAFLMFLFLIFFRFADFVFASGKIYESRYVESSQAG